MIKHPGKTPAQRRVLDAIGCGDHAPLMTKATRERMLRDGLIVELSPLKIPFVGSLCMEVRQFDMPLPIHMEWTFCMAEQFGDDEPSEGAGA